MRRTFSSVALRCLRVTVAVVGAGFLPADAGSAQPVPVGSQFQVNTYTTGRQRFPAIGPDGAGGFVVVWAGGGSSEPSWWSGGIRGQRYDSTGTPVGAEFQVSTYRHADNPVLGPSGAGGFVVAWESYWPAGSDTSYSSIRGQRYDSTGTPVGAEFQVNTYTTDYQRFPAIGPDGAGGFVVVWTSGYYYDTDGSGSSIQAQRFDSSGTPIGGEFQVNTYTTGDQIMPALGSDGAGGFVVVWHGDGGTWDPAYHGFPRSTIQGRRYDSTGTPVGGEFYVSTDVGSYWGAALGPDGAGGFVVVWNSERTSRGSDRSHESIHGQRYDSAGTRVGNEFQVNTYTTDHQRFPAIGPDGAGGFVVVWNSTGSSGSDTSDRSIQGQRYDSAGTAVGGEFQVNTYTTGRQRFPAIGPDGAGGFVVVWDSYGSSVGSDTSAINIQGQRFRVSATSTTTPSITSSTATSSTSSTTAATSGLSTSTTTTTRPECLTARECDDGNLCTDGACVGGRCQHINNTAQCDDGDICTGGDVCGNGTCSPGTPLDASGVAGFVTGTTNTPAACAADKKDKRRSKKILKRMNAAKKKLDKSATAQTGMKRHKHLRKAGKHLRKAKRLADRFETKISSACHAAVVEQVTQAQLRTDCLQ